MVSKSIEDRRENGEVGFSGTGGFSAKKIVNSESSANIISTGECETFIVLARNPRALFKSHPYGIYLLSQAIRISPGAGFESSPNCLIRLSD